MSTLQSISPNTLNTLGREVTARSLDLLKTIERVIDSLCVQQRMLETLSSITQECAESIEKAPKQKAMDPEGSTDSALLGAQQTTKQLCESLVARTESAMHVYRVRAEDGLVEEFTNTLVIVGELHNTVNALRW